MDLAGTCRRRYLAGYISSTIRSLIWGLLVPKSTFYQQCVSSDYGSSSADIIRRNFILLAKTPRRRKRYAAVDLRICPPLDCGAIQTAAIKSLGYEEKDRVRYDFIALLAPTMVANCIQVMKKMVDLSPMV
jgi:hypothetical protein